LFENETSIKKSISNSSNQSGYGKNTNLTSIKFQIYKVETKVHSTLRLITSYISLLMMHYIVLLSKAFNKNNKARIRPPAIILEAKVLTLADVN